jgi:outer membrane protein TolC
MCVTFGDRMKEKILIVSLMLSGLAHAADINLDSTVEQLKRDHIEFHRYDLLLKRKKLLLNEFDAQGVLTLGGESLVDKTTNFDTFTSGNIKTKSTVDELYLAKSLVKTGTQLKLSARSQSLKSQEPRLPGQLKYNSRYGLTLEQDLWRNYFGSANRLRRQLIEKDFMANKQNEEDNLEQLVFDYSLSFVDWFYSYEKQKIVAKKCALYKKNVGLIKKKRKSNLVTKSELNIAKYKQLSCDSEKKRANIEQSISKRVLSDIYLIKLNERSKPVEPNLIISDDLVDQNKKIKFVQLQVDTLKENIKLNKNLAMGETKLFVDFQRHNNSNSYSKSFEAENNDYRVGISYSIPLGESPRDAQVQLTRNRVSNLEKQKSYLKKQIFSNLTTNKSKTSLVKELIKQARLREELTKNSKAQAKNDFQRGKLSFQDFVDIQESYYDTLLEKLAFIVEKKKLILEKRRITGQLLGSMK